MISKGLPPPVSASAAICCSCIVSFLVGELCWLAGLVVLLVSTATVLVAISMRALEELASTVATALIPEVRALEVRGGAEETATSTEDETVEVVIFGAEDLTMTASDDVVAAPAVLALEGVGHRAPIISP